MTLLRNHALAPVAAWEDRIMSRTEVDGVVEMVVHVGLRRALSQCEVAGDRRV